VSLQRVGDVLRARGELAPALERYERALAIYEGLRERLETPQSEVDLSKCLGLVGRARLGLGDSMGALDAHRRGRDHARAAGARELELTHARDLTAVWEVAGDDTRAAEALEDALRLSGDLRRPDWSVDDRRKLVDINRRLGRTKNAADQEVALGVSLLELGRLEDASASLRSALQAAQAEEHFEAEVRAEIALGQVALAQGAHEEARTHAQRARTIASAAGMPGIEAEAALQLATVHSVRDEPAEAVALCDEVLDRLSREPRAQLEVRARLVRGQARMQQGDSEAAMVDLRAALVGAEQTGSWPDVALAWFILGIAKASLEEAMEAAAALVVAAYLAAQRQLPILPQALDLLRTFRDELGEPEFDAALRSLHETGDAALSRVAGRDTQVFRHLPEDIGDQIRGLLEPREPQSDDHGEQPPSRADASEA
jgi:tetratricopeptide (TPR) repeat protein